jgi:Co/Zn/Cd efflux system component
MAEASQKFGTNAQLAGIGTQQPFGSPFEVQAGSAGASAAAKAEADAEAAHLAKWTRRARIFVAITIAFSFVMGVLAIVAGALVDSAALIAYGLESFVDLFASVLVLWRFWEDASNEAGMKSNLEREERANVGIAATFIVIAIITGGDAISHLVQHKSPDDSTVVLAFAVISIVVLTAFGIYKLWVNKYVESKALEQDAVASFSVSVLSIGILVSAVLYQFDENIWWLDAVVAIAVTVALAIYSIPILVTRPWWRKSFWRPGVHWSDRATVA